MIFPLNLRQPLSTACPIAAYGILFLGAGSLMASPESDAVIGNFGNLEWIAGINSQEANNGNGWLPGYEGQPATEVNLSEPHSASGDLLGNVYVADKNSHAIRVIGLDGKIRLVAGTNTAGFNGDGLATQCQLNGPQNAYPMPDGSFYILDTGNRRIRKVSAGGQLTTVITESANLSRGLWVQRDESMIYYCTNNALKRWTPAQGGGAGTVMANGFVELGNIDVARNGDVYLTDRGSSQVYRIAPNATPSTFTPVVVAGTGGTVNSDAGANGQPALTTGLLEVRGIAFHPAGGYFLATHRGGDVWYVDSAGAITLVVSGDNGNSHATDPRPLPTTSNVMAEVRSVSVAPNGDLLMATNDAGFIRRARYLGPLPLSATVAMMPPAAPGGNIRMEWTQPSDSWFRLESTADPAMPVWTPRLIGPATGAVQEWTEPAPTSTQSRQFYRVRSFRGWPN